MTAAAFETLRKIAADPQPCQTARQIIEARVGRKLPATADLPPDLRDAIKRLAIEKIRARTARNG